MNELYLTLEQNMSAARIFLNTFGLILEDFNDINELSKIKIFNTSKIEVGQLHFDNGKVLIDVKYNNCVLKASYDIAKIFGLVDIECQGALYGQWSSNIIFQIIKDNATKINGEFLIGNSIDSQYGIRCDCHPLIKCEIPNKGYVTLKILRDGRFFCVQISSREHIEKIDVMPFNDIIGFIVHEIKYGTLDKKRHCYPYRKYAGIFNRRGSGKNDDKLCAYLIEEEYNNTLSYCDEVFTKVATADSKKDLVQKGLLMQKLDPSMYEKIHELKELFSIGEVSLLENLISVCYDGYSEEEIEALLRMKRKKMNYQDGSDNLINSYYGIDKDNYFLSLDAQKRLFKLW